MLEFREEEMETIDSPESMKAAYATESCAEEYIDRRFTCPLGAALHRKQVGAVRAAIRDRRPSGVLELACGPGRLTAEVDPCGARAVAVDASAPMLAVARQRLDRAGLGGAWSLVQGDAFALDLGRTFDLIYSFRFIRHFHLDDRQRLYATIRRHLASGGTIMFDVVNRRTAAPALARNGGHMPVFDEYYDRPEFIAEVAAEGLEPVSFLPVHPFHRFQSIIQNLVNPRSAWLAHKSVDALERLSGSQPLEWVVQCRLA